MTNQGGSGSGGRVNTLIGPFPAEVNERHNAWVAASAGAMWQRDDVAQELRSAVTLGVLTALGAERELSVHIRRAVKAGRTVARGGGGTVAPLLLVRRRATREPGASHREGCVRCAGRGGGDLAREPRSWSSGG